MNDCEVTETDIEQIINSKLDGQEQRMIMSYYTQLQRESKEIGVCFGIALTIICYFVAKAIFEINHI